MKNVLKSSYLVLLFTIGLLVLNSCSKEDDTKDSAELQQNNLGFPVEDFANRTIVFSDNTGKNSVTVKFYANSEETLNEYLDIWEYNISPVFEESEINPVDKESDASTLSGSDSLDKNDVFTEIIDVQLEKEATGFVLNVNRVGSMLKSGYGHSVWIHGPKWWHHAKVDWLNSPNSNNAISVEFWTQYRSLSDWRKKAVYTLYLTYSSAEYYYGDYRIRVKVWHNWNNYAVYFKHWSGDYIFR
jgi:hypothetical protein